jgi:ribonuclease HI
MISETKAEDLQIISTILYSIWQARNDREFNGKFIPPVIMMQRAIQVLHEFQSHQNSKALPHPKDAENTRHDISWSLPPNGALKLNVDAHSLSDGRWGLGLLLRRDDGGCVGAATRVRKGTECALLAEAMGLQEAVELIQQWNLQNTIIELDARVIVDAFHKSLTPRTIWGNLVNLCAKKVRDRKDVAVVWTRRSGNNAAHELANWAGIEPNKEWRSNFPSCISYHIQKDMGVTSLS